MIGPTTQKLLLIGWDAADWDVINPLLAQGRMPHLARLIHRGVSGSLHSLQPMLSPILWTSIATGKRAYHHGIHGFVEPTPDGAGLRPASSTSRRCKALWNILSQSGRRCHTVGWFASHPAEAIRGVSVSNQFAVPAASATATDWRVPPGSVCPAALAESLAELRLHPSQIGPETMAPFIPQASWLDRRDPETRRLLEAFAKRLAECASVHAVATELMEDEPWDFCTVYYEAIDQIGHDFMPFHPPLTNTARPEHFEAFRGVMDATYELHDMMLGRLVELAGPEAAIMIVSDHGFHSGARRPSTHVEPAQWHRNLGVFVAAGPGFRNGAQVHGATLLDIAPTILAAMGLPVGRDMEGRVLVSAFEYPPTIERIESWENAHDPTKPASPSAIDDPEAEAAAMRQLIELGYLDAPEGDAARDVAKARTEQKFNLASTCVDGGRHAQAVALARELVAESPLELRYVVLLGQTAVSAGDADALALAIDTLAERWPGHRQIALFRGMQCWIAQDVAGAIEHFESAERQDPRDVWLLCRIGRAYLRLRRWPEAEAVFRRVLSIDPDHPEACYGLSVALPRQGRVEEGIEHGLRAVTITPDYLLAHFQLGAILSRMGWFDRAIEAFHICLSMYPDFALAHRYVSLISTRMGRTAQADVHRDIAQRLVAEGVVQPQVD